MADPPVAEGGEVADGGAHAAGDVEFDGRAGAVGVRVGVQEDHRGVGGQLAELTVVR